MDNTGSYTCVCNTGYEYNPAGNTCDGKLYYSTVTVHVWTTQAHIPVYVILDMNITQLETHVMVSFITLQSFIMFFLVCLVQI